MAEVWFVPDKPALALFKSWGGTLGQAFGRLERETVFRQKNAAHVKSGKLAASVTSKRRTLGSGLVFEAGSWTVVYAATHELGSKPHKIYPKKAGGSLAFFWPKVGKPVVLKSVSHPGTRPYHFLTTGMERAMNMWERGG